MTAAYFEDHPTDPDKVILRKPYSTDCPNCEYHRKRAQLWRDEAYKQAGHPLPEREQNPVAFASHGVVNWIADKQFQHEALLYSAPQRTWVGLTDEEILKFQDIVPNTLSCDLIEFARAIEAKLKEKNND
jgi:hypothetical protein